MAASEEDPQIGQEKLHYEASSPCGNVAVASTSLTKKAAYPSDDENQDKPCALPSSVDRYKVSP